MPKLRATLINCSLKGANEKSSTQAMLNKVIEVLERRGVECKTIRAVEAGIKFGVESDMGPGDGWPPIRQQILDSQILVIGTPIWLGERCSVCQMVLERMDAMLNETNEQGQLPLYNKVAGVCVVGNEDGAQNVGAGVLYNLMQFGATIPPNAEAYWVGPAGGQDDFVDVAQDDKYVRKLVSYLGNNLVLIARMLQDNPIPAEGNRSEK
ncbi:flavodoxin family protein [Fimbriimonas ginsengisoli]|uniref:BRAMP domain protein n=1 Tax=Fimbriimonas ginsengisoli Gsoil 348 TaxID=661478 RepID=A0A068NN65_FIMGI|nr:NAD(P)H-dependent oxidoreductase [Fimbriimonas ginsengisoli]AIE84180.1 BRAMP domain protein [Fimbriimonas ginsengisoli Gsoil 348]